MLVGIGLTLAGNMEKKLRLRTRQQDANIAFLLKEEVHTKRRNRLHQDKMNDLVFVMYNSKLMSRQRRRQRQAGEYYIDDVSSHDEFITEKEKPVLPPQKEWIRSLDRIAHNDAAVDKENESDIENGVEYIFNNLAEACDGDVGVDQDLDAYTYEDPDGENNNANEENVLGGNNLGPSCGSSSAAVAPMNDDINLDDLY
ncbi:Zf-BED domain-containing protein/DUF659 domain-containing domain-containing protein [Hordeum vulgare]|nr:Zf-BED domain-containing protein/DUF659 domain-containing domain-containing protein [Hordeum vulgare]